MDFGFFERGNNEASKDIAESPAALPNAQKKTENLKLTFHFRFSIFNSKKNCSLLSVVRCLLLTLHHEIFNRLSRKYRCRI